MDKLYFVTVRDGSPDRYLAGGNQHRHVPILTPNNPFPLLADEPTEFELVVGDDLSRPQPEGRQAKVTCHVQTTGAGDVTATLNGKTLGDPTVAGDWLDFPVPPPWLKTRYGIDLEPLAEETCEELGVGVLPDKYLGEASKAIMEAGNRLGQEWEPMPKLLDVSRFRNGLSAGARTSLGLNYGERWTAVEYVRQAVEAGATLLTRAECTRVLVENGYGMFANPIYLERLGYTDYLRRIPKTWREVFVQSMKNGEPEPYGRNCQNVYNYMTWPADEMLRYLDSYLKNSR